MRVETRYRVLPGIAGSLVAKQSVVLLGRRAIGLIRPTGDGALMFNYWSGRTYFSASQATAVAARQDRRSRR